MSRLHEYAYQLERKKREEIFNNRVRGQVENFYRSYMNQYSEMINKGYEYYIPQEMQRLKKDLSDIRNFLESSPKEARNISFQVGNYIKTVQSLGKDAIEKFEFNERMRAAKLREEKITAKSTMMHKYFKFLEKINNPVVINYAQKDFENLKEKIMNNKINEEEMENQIKSIVNQAEIRAEKWKEERKETHRKENVSETIKETAERIKKENIEDVQMHEKLIKKIENLENEMAEEKTDYKEIEKKLAEIETETDEKVINEEVRRQTVKAVISQLKKQEFTIKNPQIIKTEEKNYVKITAKKPSGKRAVCNIDINGKIAYKFDNYEGMACLKEIEKFETDLEKIYSVKLSDKRVLWSNPDRLSADAGRIPVNRGDSLNDKK